MLVLTVLFLFVSSGLADYTSSSFANYTSSKFANNTVSEFANDTVSEFANTPRAPKFFFGFRDIKKFFDRFVSEYGKIYKSFTEMRKRLHIFKENLVKANYFNTLYNNTTFGVTEYSDLTPEEFSQTFSSLKGPYISCRRGAVRNYPSSKKDMPMFFDWRLYGAVTPVKHQGRCNSCYAWSAIGNLEGQYAISYNRLQNFSAQQIIDCDTHSKGCRSGWTTNAGMYLVDVGGAMLESAYPPTKGAERCYHDPTKFVVQVTGCQQFPNIDEETLRKRLVEVGPLSVAVDSRTWQMYTGGILHNCGKSINHAVLLVGYGEENGIPYWTIKNTAGMKWGEEGYIRIPRGQNACGIVNEQIMTVYVKPPNQSIG